MPDEIVVQSAIHGDSKAESFQQSEEARLNGFHNDEKVDGARETQICGTSESREVHQSSHCGWEAENHHECNFKPETIPIKVITRHKSEGDVRMLNGEEKHSMKSSESAPCLTKRKRSSGAVGDDGNTEVSKRTHVEEGW